MKKHFKSLALLIPLVRCRRAARDMGTLLLEDDMDIINIVKCCTAAINAFRFTWKSLKETEVANKKKEDNHVEEQTEKL